MPSIITLPRDAWRLARPYFNSEERWPARGRLVAVIAMNLSLVGLSVVLNYWYKDFYNSLQNKDFDAFLGLLLTWYNGKGGFMPGFVGIASVYIAISVFRTYIRQGLQIRWRRWMTTHLLQDWLADCAYYRIALQSAGAPDAATDNPDQRIAEDLRLYVDDTLTLSLDLLSNIVSFVSFVTILWSLSDPVSLLGVSIPHFMVWLALLYAIAGTGVTHLVGRKLVDLSFRKEKVEADFRFSLGRLRENLEGVALYRGEAQERAGLEAQFGAIRSNWWEIMGRTKIVNAVVAGYSQASVIFPYAVAAPMFFFGTLDLGGLTQTASAFGNVQDSLSWFVTSYSSLATWRATINRLTFFRDAIDAARAAGRDGVAVVEDGGADTVLDHPVLRLPDGSVLLDMPGLVLKRGQSVAFTGRSGSGKSTLFRALAGIWPFGSGVVHPGAGSRLFLPQRPYFPQGTLRAALCYPAAADIASDAALVAVLEAAGLGHLAARLDQRDNWGRALSGGEQQRLAVARALLLKPDWLYLDEATASLDQASEQALLGALRAALPETTMVSITHRPEVATLHDVVHVLERPDGAPGRIVTAQG